MAFGFSATKLLSKKACARAKAKVRASERYWNKHASGRKGGARSLSAEKAKGDPANNRDRTVVEVCNFVERKTPKPFTGYYKAKPGQTPTITSFTGVRLCTVASRSGTAVQARCIDGNRYSGRPNGSGMWINMRPLKGKR